MIKEIVFENINNNTKEYPKHFHECYAIGFTTRGIFNSRVEGRASCFYKNDIRVVNPYQLHQGKSDSWGYLNFYPPVKLLKQINEDVTLKSEPPIFEKGNIRDEKLLFLLKRFFNTFCKKENEMAIYECLMELLSYMVTNYSSSKKRVFYKSDKKIIQRSVEFINDNITGCITLDDISKNIGISKYHFLRIFKNQTGVTPHKFILNRRVELAKDMILKGEDISTASIKAGFSDQSHFNRYFKSFFGYSIGVLRSQKVVWG